MFQGNDGMMAKRADVLANRVMDYVEGHTVVEILYKESVEPWDMPQMQQPMVRMGMEQALELIRMIREEEA